MVQDLYNVLMGIPDPFGFLDRIVQTPPWELWNREIMTSIDLDVLGLEELLSRERELLDSPFALPGCAETAEADAALAAGFLEAYDRAADIPEKR